MEDLITSIQKKNLKSDGRLAKANIIDWKGRSFTATRKLARQQNIWADKVGWSAVLQPYVAPGLMTGGDDDNDDDKEEEVVVVVRGKGRNWRFFKRCCSFLDKRIRERIFVSIQYNFWDTSKTGSNGIAYSTQISNRILMGRRFIWKYAICRTMIIID